MTESTSSIANRTLRLPTLVIVLLLAASLLSTFLAGGTFTKSLALVLFVANIFGVYRSLGVETLKETYSGNGPVDKKALRKEAMKAQPIPLWLAVTLVLGSVWTGIAVVKFVGFVIGLLFILGAIVLVAGAGYFAYWVVQKRGSRG